MNKRVFVQTYGCQMNVYDSNKIFELLDNSHHYKPTKQEKDADLLIMNTCSIREKAQEKVFSELGRWRKLKEKNQKLIIGVGGCVAAQEAEHIKTRAPFVDIVFGPQTIHHLPKMITQIHNDEIPQPNVEFKPIEKFDNLPLPGKTGPSAFVSIMEGCSKFCSFCIVPYTRGQEVSRSFDDILLEVHELVKLGAKEIHLLGQNVNGYNVLMNGSDTQINLALLIRFISKIDGVERIRFTTSHPAEFDQSLIDAYRDVKKLPNYLHLPVQSGSNRILELMKRGYTNDTYRNIIKKLRNFRPNISISSDFIIGYPGETEDDFMQTYELIKDLNIDYSFSFIYSKRPGTPASLIDDNVSLEEKKRRLSRIQGLINQQAHKISEDMIGSEQTILVTGTSKKSDEQLTGRTENNRSLNFNGYKELIGKMVTVRVKSASLNSLQGELVK